MERETIDRTRPSSAPENKNIIHQR